MSWTGFGWRIGCSSVRAGCGLLQFTVMSEQPHDMTISVWHMGEQSEVERPAWQTAAAGLVVQRSLLPYESYVVTHQRSGLLLAAPMSGAFDDAMALAHVLGMCGDWDRPGEALRNDSAIRSAANQVIGAVGARPSTADKTDRDVAVQGAALRR